MSTICTTRSGQSAEVNVRDNEYKVNRPEIHIGRGGMKDTKQKKVKLEQYN